MACGISSLCTVENCPRFIRGGPEAQLLFKSGFACYSATAWPWHHARYLGGVLSGLPDTPTSGLKIPQMMSFFCVTVRESSSENPKCPFGLLFSR